MFTVKKKVFRDNVHDYIYVPEIIVKKIIDTPLFQRLRNVEQTGMRTLYPAARHDRFIHSLGTYHLGVLAFSSFMENARRLTAVTELDECTEDWWRKQYLLFVLACLLHDCAHAPFSHTYEDYYTLERVKVPSSLSDTSKGKFSAGKMRRIDYEMLQEYVCCDIDFESDFLDGVSTEGISEYGKAHEKMSALMVKRYFDEGICEVFKALYESGQLAFEVPDDEDYAFMARMITGCLYREHPSGINSMKNCIISLLNSPTLDVDGLDYSVRDTQNSGMDNWSIDYHRILNSLTVVEATSFDNSSVTDFNLDGIWTEKTSIQVDTSSTVLSFTGVCSVRMTDEGDLERYAKIENSIDKFAWEPMVQFCASKDMNNKIFVDDKARNYTVWAGGACRFKGKMSGKISGVVLKPLSLYKEVKGASQRFVMAYDKNAISVVENALEARNQFQTWVYTHPRVLYRTSFLQCHLLKLASKFLCCMRHNKKFGKEESQPSTCDPSACPIAEKYNTGENFKAFGEEEFVSEILGLASFYNPKDIKACQDGLLFDKGFVFHFTSDDDVNALFKWVYVKNELLPDEIKSKEISKYFGQYFSRNGAVPVWKSIADYRFVTKDLQTVGAYPPSYDEGIEGASNSLLSYSYKIIEPSCVKNEELATYLEESGHDSLIAVKAHLKKKRYKLDRTYIVFKGEVMRMGELTENLNKGASPDEYCYIFFD